MTAFKSLVLALLFLCGFARLPRWS